MLQNLSKIELAWAAGFFDGEGTTGAYTNGKDRLHLKIQVGRGKRYLIKRDSDGCILPEYAELIGAGA